jgi:hypothetical protein
MVTINKNVLMGWVCQSLGQPEGRLWKPLWERQKYPFNKLLINVLKMLRTIGCKADLRAPFFIVSHKTKLPYACRLPSYGVTSDT